MLRHPQCTGRHRIESFRPCAAPGPGALHVPSPTSQGAHGRLVRLRRRRGHAQRQLCGRRRQRPGGVRGPQRDVAPGPGAARRAAAPRRRREARAAHRRAHGRQRGAGDAAEAGAPRPALRRVRRGRPRAAAVGARARRDRGRGPGARRGAAGAAQRRGAAAAGERAAAREGGRLLGRVARARGRAAIIGARHVRSSEAAPGGAASPQGRRRRRRRAQRGRVEHLREAAVARARPVAGRGRAARGVGAQRADAEPGLHGRLVRICENLGRREVRVRKKRQGAC